jgi:hypothetical protein
VKLKRKELIKKDYGKYWNLKKLKDHFLHDIFSFHFTAQKHRVTFCQSKRKNFVLTFLEIFQNFLKFVKISKMNFYGKKKFFNLSDNRTFHLVYHPMIIENPENAIRSIGGFKNFASIVQDRRSMMLSVQPDNEYHAGMFNDRPKSGKVTTQLVIKFQKNKRTGAIRSQVLGVVKNAYHFNSICDFQFLPLEKQANSDNCFHDLVPKIVPTNLTDALSWWDRPPADDESLAANFLPPYIFSRYRLSHLLFLTTHNRVSDIQNHRIEFWLQKNFHKQQLMHQQPKSF